MYVTIVHVSVKPGMEDAFIAATARNHKASVQEAGNLRFDVLRLASDPSRFVLYEAYESQAHATAHKQTPHYLRWREEVEDMMAEPRQGIVYEGLYPR